MAFLAALFGFIGRFAGKVLTTTLGWASTLLFGRVPQQRQVVLALVTFGSVVWAALVIGVVLPEIGAFLVAAVPAPDVVDRGWIRIAMLIGAVVVPAVVGIASLFVLAPADRPRGRALLEQVIRGYPLCAALAATLVILAAVGIVRFVHHRAIGWDDAHVPIVVHPGGYDRVVADLERALDDAGLSVDRRPAPVPLALPGRMIGRIAGPGIRSLVPDNLVELIGPDLEVGLYPSDISIAGKKALVARARAAIATRLTATAASMTTTAEAQVVEAKLEALTAPRTPGARPGTDRPDPRTAASTLKAIDQELAILNVPHDEWEILYRQRLQVERDMLAGQAPGSVLPSDATGGTAAATTDAAAERRRKEGPLGRRLEGALAGAAILLVAVDVVMAVIDRRRER
jgi:hypothetical protein